jgi:hypothetical protein
MLHACAQKFDVIGNFENFWELNKAIVTSACSLVAVFSSDNPNF